MKRIRVVAFALFVVVWTVVALFQAQVVQALFPEKSGFSFVLNDGDELKYYWYLQGGQAFRAKLQVLCSNVITVIVLYNVGSGWHQDTPFVLNQNAVRQETDLWPRLAWVSNPPHCAVTVSSTTKNVMRFIFLPFSRQPKLLTYP